MKIITESEMNFGKFDEETLFHIEDSKIYKDLKKLDINSLNSLITQWDTKLNRVLNRGFSNG